MQEWFWNKNTSSRTTTYFVKMIRTRYGLYDTANSKNLIFYLGIFISPNAIIHESNNLLTLTDNWEVWVFDFWADKSLAAKINKSKKIMSWCSIDVFWMKGFWESDLKSEKPKIWKYRYGFVYFFLSPCRVSDL